MAFDRSRLAALREKYGEGHGGELFDAEFRKVADKIFTKGGTRLAPYSGVPTFLTAPYRPVDQETPELSDLEVAILGIPMDLGVTNRPGSRFGPRALRTIERIGPYNHVLGCAPVHDLKVADIGDVPFRSRYRLELSHEDIERRIGQIVAAGVAPLSVGGDHSITHPILKAVGRQAPVGLIHIDAHCDTGGAFDQTKFHHGGPFRNAVLDGVLDPTRTVQIGIRGSAEYLWEFSNEFRHDRHPRRGGARPRHSPPSSKRPGRWWATARPTSPSTSTASTRPSRRAPARRRVGGLTTREVLELLRGLKGLDIVGGDVVEVAPQYDATTNTAHAGAQMLFEILSLMVFSPSIAGRRR